MWVCACVNVHANALYPQSPEEGVRPLRPELQVIVSFWTWVLGTPDGNTEEPGVPVPVIGRLKQKHCEFGDSLGYIVKPFLTQEKNKAFKMPLVLLVDWAQRRRE